MLRDASHLVPSVCCSTPAAASRASKNVESLVAHTWCHLPAVLLNSTLTRYIQVYIFAPIFHVAKNCLKRTLIDFLF